MPTSKKFTKFPQHRQSISTKNRPYRLKCNTGNFQCGARCVPVQYKSKSSGKMAYTNCRKNATGMAKTGLEWLEYRQSRLEAINKQRATKGKATLFEKDGKLVTGQQSPIAGSPKATDRQTIPVTKTGSNWQDETLDREQRIKLAEQFVQGGKKALDEYDQAISDIMDEKGDLRGKREKGTTKVEINRRYKSPAEYTDIIKGSVAFDRHKDGMDKGGMPKVKRQQSTKKQIAKIDDRLNELDGIHSDYQDAREKLIKEMQGASAFIASTPKSAIATPTTPKPTNPPQPTPPATKSKEAEKQFFANSTIGMMESALASVDNKKAKLPAGVKRAKGYLFLDSDTMREFTDVPRSLNKGGRIANPDGSEWLLFNTYGENPRTVDQAIAVIKQNESMSGMSSDPRENLIVKTSSGYTVFSRYRKDAGNGDRRKIEQEYGKEFADEYYKGIEAGETGVMARTRQRKVDRLLSGELGKQKEKVIARKDENQQRREKLNTPEGVYGISKLRANLSDDELFQIAKDLDDRANKLSKNSDKEVVNGKRSTQIATNTFAAGNFRSDADDIRNYIWARNNPDKQDKWGIPKNQGANAKPTGDRQSVKYKPSAVTINSTGYNRFNSKGDRLFAINFDDAPANISKGFYTADQIAKDYPEAIPMVNKAIAREKARQAKMGKPDWQLTNKDGKPTDLGVFRENGDRQSKPVYDQAREELTTGTAKPQRKFSEPKPIASMKQGIGTAQATRAISPDKFKESFTDIKGDTAWEVFSQVGSKKTGEFSLNGDKQLGYSAWSVARGIAFADQTGRIDGSVSKVLREMDRDAGITLIKEMMEDGVDVEGNVSPWISQNYHSIVNNQAGRFDVAQTLDGYASQLGIEKPVRGFFTDVSPAQATSLSRNAVSARAKAKEEERGKYKEQMESIKKDFTGKALQAYENKEFSLFDAYKVYDNSDSLDTTTWDILSDEFKKKGIELPSPFSVKKLENNQGMDAVKSKLDSIEKPYFSGDRPSSEILKKNGAMPQSGLTVRTGLGREVGGAFIDYKLTPRQAQDPAVQSQVAELKAIEAKSTRSNGDLQRYKQIIDDLFLAPKREKILSHFGDKQREKIMAAMGIFTRDFKANSKNQAETSRDFVSLRNIDAGKELRKKDERTEFRDAVEGIRLLLSKAPKHEGPIYRGIRFNGKATEINRQDKDKFIADLRKKGEITLDAFASHTTSPEVALGFAGFNGGGADGTTSVIFRIKENQSGVDVSPFSKMPDEGEVLVPKGTRYKVINITDPKITYFKKRSTYRHTSSPKLENIVYVDLEEMPTKSTTTPNFSERSPHYPIARALTKIIQRRYQRDRIANY